MSEPTLFEMPEQSDTDGPSGKAAQAPFRRRSRYQRAQRDQIEFQTCALDELLPDDHQARAIWNYVNAADLSALYDRIKAVEGNSGRDPVDPRILMALWLYATIEGVGRRVIWIDSANAMSFIDGSVAVCP